MYPLFVSLAVLVGGGLAAWLLRGLGVGVRSLRLILLVGASAAFAGAKAFSIVERGGVVWWDPGWELAHGYRYPGAMLALALVAPAISRLLPSPIRLIQVGDVLAPTIALSMSVVRIGCFLAGCCHGTPTQRSWGVRFAPESPAWFAQVDRGWIEPSAAASLPVHPLQLYFAVTSVALALLLVSLRRRQRRDGWVLCLFLLLDGVLKLTLEQFRLDYRASLVVAAALAAATGVLGLVVLCGRPTRAAVVLPAGSPEPP